MSSCLSKLAACLKKFSLGKYNTVFFNKDGTNYHSSVFGGILTISLTIFLGTLSIVMIANTLYFDYLHEDMMYRMLTTEHYKECPTATRCQEITNFKYFYDFFKGIEIHIEN